MMKLLFAFRNLQALLKNGVGYFLIRPHMFEVSYLKAL
jgi:hypothetical protein